MDSYALPRSHAAAERKARALAFGPSMRLQFENALTVRHQVDEVLRIERTTDPEALQRELDSYAHLLPTGNDWRATLMIGIDDAARRARELPDLSDAAHHLSLQVDGRPGVIASANDDLPCRHLTRPSAVHFLRFDLPRAVREALFAGLPALLLCLHPAYRVGVWLPPALRTRLVTDLAPLPA